MGKSALLIAVRYGIPAALILTGQIVLATGSGPTGAGWEGWALFTGAGVAVLLFNMLLRMGTEDGQHDREEAARRYFDEHGRWPDGD
ncbi:MAG: hypothetical protein ACXVRH_13190 [Thermoleophilaceae bacterium]